MSAIPKPTDVTQGYEITRISGALLESAAKRLVSSVMRGAAGAESFLEAARAAGIDLHGFWGSIEDHQGIARVREVALAVPGAGGALMLFTSEPRGAAAEAELAAVLRETAPSPERATTWSRAGSTSCSAGRACGRSTRR